MATTKTGKKHVGVEKFIKTYMREYNKGGNQTTVANILNVTPANISLRVKRLRGIGVKLPKMNGKNSPRYSVGNLNKLVDDCR